MDVEFATLYTNLTRSCENIAVTVETLSAYTEHLEDAMYRLKSEMHEIQKQKGELELFLRALRSHPDLEQYSEQQQTQTPEEAEEPPRESWRKSSTILKPQVSPRRINQPMITKQISPQDSQMQLQEPELSEPYSGHYADMGSLYVGHSSSRYVRPAPEQPQRPQKPGGDNWWEADAQSTSQQPTQGQKQQSEENWVKTMETLDRELQALDLEQLNSQRQPPPAKSQPQIPVRPHNAIGARPQPPRPAREIVGYTRRETGEPTEDFIYELESKLENITKLNAGVRTARPKLPESSPPNTPTRRRSGHTSAALIVHTNPTSSTQPTSGEIEELKEEDMALTSPPLMRATSAGPRPLWNPLAPIAPSMKQPVGVVVREGILKVDRKSGNCQLLGTGALYLTRTIDLRFKYLQIPLASVRNQTPAPVEIKEQNGKTVASFETRSWAELEEWIRSIESLSFSLCNKFMRYVRQEDELMIHSIQVWVGTWNVGNSIPCSMIDWLPVDMDYDIIAVGSQECSYKRVLNHEDWMERLCTTLGDKYSLVAVSSLWEIKNAVFVKSQHLSYVSDIRSETVATGIANTMGNKGGAGISFYFHSTPLCFVTSHLAAHQDHVAQRNNDFREIMRRMRLGDQQVDICNRFQHVFFYGDLNYRIDLPFTDVIDHFRNKRSPQSLLPADQLKEQMREKNVFENWVEQDITFMPTYRLVRGAFDDEGKRVYNDESAQLVRQNIGPQFKRARCVPWGLFGFPNSGFKVLYLADHNQHLSDHCPVHMSYVVNTIVAPQLTASILHDLSPTFGRCFFSNLQAQIYKWEQKARRTLNVACRITGPLFPSKKIQTPAIPSNQPLWPSVIATASELSLANLPSSLWNTKHVIFEFVDIDGFRTHPLGQATVCLKGTLESFKQFDTHIMLYGMSVGRLTGTITCKIVQGYQT